MGSLANWLDSHMILNFIVSNLLWELPLALFLLFCNKISDIFHALKISRLLLRKNRETLGNGHGDYLADTFIEIWKAKDGINKTATKTYGIVSSNATCSRNSNYEILSKKLLTFKLVEIKGEKLYAVRNYRNKLVIRFIRSWLVKVTGDKENFYDSLDLNIRKNK
jgi:hypothetical protein